MKIFKIIGVILFCAISGTASTAVMAADSQIKQIFEQTITNTPGKTMIAVEVNYAPGEKTPPHHHASSAFIMAYVVQGAIRSQTEGQPVQVYQTGESWYESAGAHHIISENASDSEPAKLLAVFVIDSDHEEALITFDKDITP